MSYLSVSSEIYLLFKKSQERRGIEGEQMVAPHNIHLAG